MAARHGNGRDGGARERVGTALVSRWPLDRLPRADRGGRRAHRRHAARRGPPAHRAGRLDESSPAVVGTKPGLGARWPRHRVRLGDPRSRERTRRRRPDGDHAVSVQADSGRGAHALQRQQAAARVRRRRSHARRPPAHRRAVLRTFHRLVAEGRSDPLRLQPGDQSRQDLQLRHLLVECPHRRDPAPHDHEERRVLPRLLSGWLAHRVCRHDTRPHLVGNDNGRHARLGDAVRWHRARRGGQVHRQSSGRAALVGRRPAGIVHRTGTRQGEADGGGRQHRRHLDDDRRQRQRRRVLGGEGSAGLRVLYAGGPCGVVRDRLAGKAEGNHHAQSIGAGWPSAGRGGGVHVHQRLLAGRGVPDRSSGRPLGKAEERPADRHDSRRAARAAGPGLQRQGTSLCRRRLGDADGQLPGIHRIRPEVHRCHLPRSERG